MCTRLVRTGPNPGAREQVSTRVSGPSERYAGPGFGPERIRPSGPAPPPDREWGNWVARGSELRLIRNRMEPNPVERCGTRPSRSQVVRRVTRCGDIERREAQPWNGPVFDVNSMTPAVLDADRIPTHHSQHSTTGDHTRRTRGEETTEIRLADPFGLAKTVGLSNGGMKCTASWTVMLRNRVSSIAFRGLRLRRALRRGRRERAVRVR